MATAAGCVAAAGFIEVHIDFALGVALVGALFFSGELLFPRNCGLAMAPITAMILLIIYLASPVSIDGWTLAAQRIARFSRLGGRAAGGARRLALERAGRRVHRRS